MDLSQLSASIDAAAFRVVQESLTNVIRHAHATRVDIIAELRDGQELYVAVSDNGIELIDDRAIEIIPRSVYEHQETIARRRVPQDPNDWPPVAPALALEVGILTGDQDFLGCGCPTWTVDTLRAELDQP